MSTNNTKTPLPWEIGKCRVPMWCGGLPAGFCQEPAFGHQLPREVLSRRDGRYLFDSPPYCHGHCCPNHGGPKPGEPIVFRDGFTEEGRQMWCAVMPDFINLQESPAGFDGNGNEAIKKLREALKEHSQ